jgi:plasmid stabilization system protein ParE
MMDYLFHPEAEIELLDGIRYYEKQRKGLGKSFLNEVRRTIIRILTNPEIGSLLDDNVRRRNLHRFPYSLLYTQEYSLITILAVMHQKRRPDYRRDRLCGFDQAFRSISNPNNRFRPLTDSDPKERNFAQTE